MLCNESPPTNPIKCAWSMLVLYFFFIKAVILLVSIYLRISNVFQFSKINPITIFPISLVYFHHRISVEEEPLILPEHLSSPPVFSGLRVTRSLVLCVCFVDRCFFLLYFFLLAIVLSVHLRLMDSDFTFGIFKLFLVDYKVT